MPGNFLIYSKKSVVSALLSSDLTAGIIVIPVWVRELRRRVRKIVSKAKSEGKELSPSEIAKEAKQTEATIRNAFKDIGCDLGLTSISERDRYNDVITSSKTEKYEEKIKYEDSEDWIIKSDVETLTSCLTEEENLIVSIKFGIGCEKLTNSQIRSQLGYSRRKFTKIYNLALSKMKKKAGVE